MANLILRWWVALLTTSLASNDPCVEGLKTLVPNAHSFVERWREKGYQVERRGSDQPLRVIVFGENHGDKDRLSEQVALIRALKPDYVLHEYVGGRREYDPASDTWTKQTGEKTKDPRLDRTIATPLYELAKEMGFRVAGLDLTEEDMAGWVSQDIAAKDPKRYRWSKKEKYLFRRGEPDWYLHIYSDEVQPYREARMAERIQEYVGRSQRTIVVIQGREHLRNMNRDQRIPTDSFGYLSVDQMDGGKP